jgi:hypothetical protein
MRCICLAVSIVFVMFLASGCGEEEEEQVPTTGTVSGTVTFIGAPPEGGGEIRVSIFSILDENGDPMGPPDHYSELFEELTGEVLYEISGVSFGTYKLAAVGYKAPDWPSGRQTILGRYGVSSADDMQPDPFEVSEEKPDVTGIDIVASYAAIEQ